VLSPLVCGRQFEDSVRDVFLTLAPLGVPAKLSNEAVKCRKRAALRRIDHNIWISRRPQAQHIDARAGNRTLNLGIKSLPTWRLSEYQEGSERLNRTRIHDATVSGSLSEDL
jgi:hypothetical protein